MIRPDLIVLVTLLVLWACIIALVTAVYRWRYGHQWWQSYYAGPLFGFMLFPLAAMAAGLIMLVLSK